MIVFGGGVMVSSGGMGMGEEIVTEKGGAVTQLLAGLPAWASALVVTLGVLIVAAVVGAVLGKLYASVRYPDPEKHSVISPKIKVLFLCLLVACSVWLYMALAKKDSDALPVDGDASSAIEDFKGGAEDGIAVNGGAVAVRVG